MRYPVITSEHRVGSRWLHYLLADTLKMKTSPEIGHNHIADTCDQARKHMEDNRIVKYHHGTPLAIIEGLGEPDDYGIIGVVRNPRDRGVSRAFHDFYHPKHDYAVKSVAKGDWEAVRWIVMNSPVFMRDNWRQISELMLLGYSTRNKAETDIPYIWTSYEWMLDDTERELSKILNFLGLQANPKYVKRMVATHSFRNKSGREPGEEERTNTWRRKGIMLDWVNWYDPEMTEHTREVQEAYWVKLIRNGRLYDV